ncbi:MAG: hypothetical protein ACTSXY_01780 [Promethearchaeota archaeon]
MVIQGIFYFAQGGAFAAIMMIVVFLQDHLGIEIGSYILKIASFCFNLLLFVIICFYLLFTKLIIDRYSKKFINCTIILNTLSN